MLHIIISIVVGGICGTLAGMIMKSESPLWLDIVLGIVGGAVAKALFGLVGIGASNIIGDIIFGVIGACLVIFVVRAIKKK